MPALDILTSVFSAAWGFFTDVTVPGLGVPFSALLLAVIAIKISLALLRHIFGFGGGTGYRSSTSRNPKISDDRKDDRF